MSCRIICDFDGTIAREDVTDLLLERFALPQWQQVESDWKAGRIGSRECMLRQVDLLRATRDQLDRCLDTVAIDPTFPDFVRQAHRWGVDLLVVSDGLDYAIRRVLGRHGINNLPLYANRLEWMGEDRYRLSFPHAYEGCAKGSGTCKCQIATSGGAGLGTERPVRILIGDGASDFCAATSVHLAFAKDKLLSHCRDNGLPHVPFADFAEVTRLLGDLMQRDSLAPLTCSLESLSE